jgi:hypothetical protein
MATQEQKTVAFVLYPGLTLLDLVGPPQVFASLRRFSDHYRPVVVAERIEPIDWNQVDRDIYEPMLGPMVQQQLADRPELLAKLSP